MKVAIIQRTSKEGLAGTTVLNLNGFLSEFD